MTKVSVIIPVYNSEKYLTECLESVVNQTLTDIEIICINDGSTDNSLEILKQFQKKDNRIKIIDQENSGAGRARNVGIDKSCGEYLYFLDSDDYIKQNALEIFVSSIGDADICLCKCSYIDDSNTIQKPPHDKPVRTDNIFKIYPIPLFTKLYKTDFIKEKNIKCQEIKTCNDVYFHYASLILASSIKSIADTLIIHRESRQGSLTSSRGKSAYCILKAFYELRNLVPDNLKNEFYKCASKRFTYELQFCDKQQQTDLQKEFNKFLPFKYKKKKLFGLENDYTHIIVKILGIEIKIRAKKCPPPDKYRAYLKSWFFKTTGQVLDLENPKTFNEKIQWLKLYDSTPLKTRLADKYLVRDWVKEKIGEEYLIPLLGVWDKFDDIDFDKLPDRFVLKCNHGSGYNIIVDDKSKFNKKEARKKINKWMKENFAYKVGLELHYADIPRKIIAEKYIKPEDSNIEIQAYCFNGEIKFVSYENCKMSEQAKRCIFSAEWKPANFKISPQHYNDFDIIPSKPQYFEEFKTMVNILCKDFKFVRIDFIPINDKLIFREMTFTSGSGLSKFEPETKSLEIGNYIQIS